ncbi:MAG: hypothetical protein J6I87_01635, partial [Rikenellaceae bacterium]|nr:hypothetical protein [Rikenellaceae bacterium]
MKRYLLLLVIAIFCLPNNSFAQYWEGANYSETIDPSQSAMASTWFIGKYGGTTDFSWSTNTLKSAKKPRINRVYLLAIKNTTDEATGLTTLSWADGSSYVGEIYRTVFHGMGTMIYPDKGKYHGQWKYSHRDGIGTMVYPDGSKYVGEWVRDLPNGSGTFINPEGIAFTGKFKDGIPHGKCVMQDIDGRKYTARWYHGKLREKSIKP